ncbi:TIGR00159 family protein [Ammoniphilus oxalaticus]|uniref:Diadenylate cyclase n=1 Tax=Ammoniphilus oxalaticus TaxID=66863 RepID=A0A419SFV1_9BACL|nr:diadenylate cyclase CdaA [Ammoniphilus oxalaticus]RKD22657.1 TIGR00159 family protein [Ammoniphilus oxalaticus]
MGPLPNMLEYLSDAIDILLVTYLIYKLIIVLRGTRAIQLFKGIIVIVVTWLLSTYFGLRTLQWLMSQALNIGLLAILIIFQPELRRALEQLGRGRIFSRSNQPDDQVALRMVGEINKAMQYMSKRRIGALIVLEKETGLSDYIETGIEIGGKVSSELLINIFIPNTPLHDGAVIIRKEDVMAAGCYLPLSENPMINKELGTRHRAAIGMSEVSDAISLIVSEETGQISLARNSEINRNLSEDELQEFLALELQPPVRASRPLWQRRRGKENDG